MLRVFSSLLVALTVLVNCGGIPAVNTATISKSPASAKQFAKAKQVARVCARFPDKDSVFRGLRSLGYSEGRYEVRTRDGNVFTTPNFVEKTSGDLYVRATQNSCVIGLRNMTPEQSYELAKIWASKYDAQTNAEAGQGLSDHAVQAWSAEIDGSNKQILIGASKTWGWDSMIPSNFRETPGASVSLLYGS